MYAPYKLFALLDCANHFSLTPKQVMRGLPFTANDLENPPPKTTIQHYITACENVVELCDNPILPLQVGHSLRLSAYGIYGFALLCGPSVGSSFEFAVRYHRLATPLFKIDFETVADQFVWVFPNENSVEYSQEIHSFLLFQQISQHVTHIRDIIRTNQKPISIEIATKPPSTPEIFEEFFECPVRFNASATKIIYEMSILVERPTMMNPISHATLKESCRLLLGTLPKVNGLSKEVWRIIMESPASFPTMGQVANHLSMTTRTLRRKLKTEQQTYSDILNEVRNAQAKKYLSANSFSIEDISHLLGFSDASNFRNAFKRWNDLSPSEYKCLTVSENNTISGLDKIKV